jgi:hypothetical protein
MSRLPFGSRLLPVFLTLLAAACGDPPTKEMNQAQGAIDAARAAGAEQFAPEEFQGAVGALQRSYDAVDQRDYRQALALALDARERAQDAAKSGADAKARTRSDVARLVHVAELALESTEKAVHAAPATASSQLAHAESEMTRAKAAIDEAQAALARDDYAAVRAAVDGLPERLTKIASEINAATSARRPRRPVPRR